MLKLQPSLEQATLLRETVQAANAAANQISATAWQTQTFGQFDLHKLCYAETRVTSGLSAQVVVRLIAKVADAYKLDQARQRRFQSLASNAGYRRASSRWRHTGRMRASPLRRCRGQLRHGQSQLDGRGYSEPPQRAHLPVRWRVQGRLSLFARPGAFRGASGRIEGAEEQPESAHESLDPPCEKDNSSLAMLLLEPVAVWQMALGHQDEGVVLHDWKSQFGVQVNRGSLSNSIRRPEAEQMPNCGQGWRIFGQRRSAPRN